MTRRFSKAAVRPVRRLSAVGTAKEKERTSATAFGRMAPLRRADVEIAEPPTPGRRRRGKGDRGRMKKRRFGILGSAYS
ncbi:MAG: hypothetical protein IKT12_07280, partial [Thermoguttaceae bacterium]|nr:hypothetical protein [Thermoguttaceae bacterium]